MDFVLNTDTKNICTNVYSIKQNNFESYEERKKKLVEKIRLSLDKFEYRKS